LVTAEERDNDKPPYIGEAGTVTVEQEDASAWCTQELKHSYMDPVVVMSPVSHNGGQPATVRVRNVSSDRFEFQIDEWKYLDGGHKSETLGYVVMEAGAHTLGDGTQVQAGTVAGVNHDWTEVPFSP
jgi:hypothetical protein